ERTLFYDVSFDVFQKDHIGLVGVNGCGKTTLLQMLIGRESIDGGQISIGKTVRVAALEQAPVWAEGETLLQAVLHCFDHFKRMEEELHALSERMIHAETVTDVMVRRQAEVTERYQHDGGLTYQSRTRSALLGLGFTEEELSSQIARMSGGQMRKASLAKILLSDADLLLLDEPTNHLDIMSLEWLEEFLSNFSGAYIVISHDRYFLDHVCNRIFELENGTLHLSSGNYTQYVERKLDEREYALRRYDNGLREIKRIKGIIEQQRRWNQQRNFITIASKEKQIERLKSQLVKPEDAPQAIRFHLCADELTANEVIVCKHLKKQFGQKVLFSDLNLMIRNGERVCLIGMNGCGKTTLLRILLGLEQPDDGTYKLGANVKAGYFAQSTMHASSTETVLDALENAFPQYERKQIRNLLGTFLFQGDDVFKQLQTLSGGELARVQLLKMMLAGNNVLLLDEPTNHLDIPSCEALENALSDYGGTMLIITHDRYLANRIADRIILMDKTGLQEFEGDWDSYKAASLELQQNEPPEETVEKNAYVLNKERRSAMNRAKGAVERAEQRISELEETLALLEPTLISPEIATDYEATSALCEKIDMQRQALECAYSEWEEAERTYSLLSQEDV
ncbi:MAG: ABC-F family ATP-binding cassette domain-containing protein, partial [Clostridia bacterium]